MDNRQREALRILEADFSAFLDKSSQQGFNDHAITFVVINRLITWYLKRPGIGRFKAISLLWSVGSRSVERVIEEDLQK